ncbi:uncharacterized protein CANTADRAFT_32632, partial [Suhomyces tanzawaensis NRRL Y-17324]
MSQRTLSRLPPHVSAVVSLYSKAVARYSLYPSKPIQEYMQRTSGEHERFQNYKLRANAYNSHDFPPLVSKTIRPIFKAPLQVLPGEDVSTEELVASLFPNQLAATSPVFKESLHSHSHRTAKQNSDYTARIISALASYYSPFQAVPPVASLQNSVQWYRKLLQNTPIVLVLRKKHRLFSSSSLAQLDVGTVEMAQRVTRLGNTVAQDDEGVAATRSYHFTNLNTIDLFALALQEHVSNSTRLKDTIFASEPRFVDHDGNTVEKATVVEYLQHHPVHELIRTLGKYEQAEEMGQLLPFDMEYTSHHILTIEGPVVERNHQELLDMLDSSEFEVVAARISLQHPAIHQFFT